MHMDLVKVVILIIQTYTGTMNLSQIKIFKCLENLRILSWLNKLCLMES